MDKLKMHSLDGVARNIELIGNLFPNAVTEVMRDGKVERAIDFDVLRQELSDCIVEGREERYQFTWPDKKKAMLAANAPITATLRPVVEDSVGRDGTPGGFDSENLYIEGDNLEVLKLLQETYLGKVKMIYIDPPYNTGNDFVYEDDFAQSTGEYMENSGQYDEAGNRMVTNTESNGRFHTDWLNMIYPRLRLAKDLLTEDGIIFISIDDGEVGNLYAKNIPEHGFLLNSLPYDESRISSYTNPDNDPRGPWASVDITGQTGRAPKSQFYEITTPSGKKYFPPEGRCWAMAESTFNTLYADNRLWFGENGDNRPRQKKFLKESDGQRPWTWWDNKFASYNQASNKELMKLFDGKLVFDNPKPVQLLLRIITLATKKDNSDIVLDFFSGSATTAHAVMSLNNSDGGNRRYICVQMPQDLKDTGNSFKSNNVALELGYRNICEIGKERIRRAGRKIKEEAGLTAPADLDIGFRCLRLDESNMKPVYYTPDEVAQTDLFSLVDNVKPDRTPEDLLFQVMLDLGVLLSSPIEIKEIAGKKVFNVADGFLLACFDHDVTDETVKAIAQMKPYYAVFRDSSMASDSVATNFDQIFETYSPDTVRKVL